MFLVWLEAEDEAAHVFFSMVGKQRRRRRRRRKNTDQLQSNSTV
jgi:hypothetical protein